jgi:hypothetical protein
VTGKTDNAFAGLTRDLVHHAKVVVDKAPAGCPAVYADVAGVGIAVEETVV